VPKLLILFLYDYKSLLEVISRGKSFFIIQLTVEDDDISKYFHLDEHLQAETTVQLTSSGHCDKPYS